MKTICNKQNNIFNIIRGYLIIGVVLIMIFTNTAPVNAGIGIGKAMKIYQDIFYKVI